jgi:hypothetical protein
MTAPDDASTVAVITADMTHRNDDEPAPGRITIYADCNLCGDGTRRVLGAITPGRWRVQHTHDGRYAATLLRLNPTTEETP